MILKIEISISLIGSAGIGFLWGWMIGNLIIRVRRPLFDRVVISGATLSMATEVLVMVNGWALAFFLSTTSIAALLHLGWRRELYKRFGLSDANLKGDLS
jgi:hypothetical protein